MDQTTLSEEMRRRSPRIILNLIKAAIVILIIEYMIPYFIPREWPLPLVPETMGVTVGVLLSAFYFIVIIYYGYRILRDIRILTERSVDLLVSWFGIPEEKTSLRRAAIDVIWIIGTFLAAAAVLPFVSAFQNIPTWVHTSVSVLFFVIAMVFVYDFGRTVYAFSRVRVDSFTGALASRVENAEKAIRKRRKRKKKKKAKKT